MGLNFSKVEVSDKHFRLANNIFKSTILNTFFRILGSKMVLFIKGNNDMMKKAYEIIRIGDIPMISWRPSLKTFPREKLM